MVKRIRTLLTLFLLVMGTTMSWAEFNDFKIDLSKAVPTPEDSKVIPDIPSWVTQISYPQYGARFNASDPSHGWQWAAFQFAVDGPVDIVVGGCQFSGVNATITDINDNVLAELDTKTVGCGGSALYRYTGKATTLRVYCGQYCPYLEVKKNQASPEEDFTATWDWTEDDNTLSAKGIIQNKYCWLASDDNSSVSMFVDATQGKLSHNTDKAQCINNTRLLVPVYSIDDEISVIGWGGKYTKYSIHGTIYPANATVKADADDVKQGYIVIAGTDNNNYLKSVTLKHTASSIAFEDFKIDFRSNPYTVVLPVGSGLPACVTVDGGSFHEEQHGYSNAVVTVKVDGPVKFTIGSCGFNSAAKDGVIAKVSINGGEPVDINNDTDCDNTGVGNYKKFVEYRYNKEEAATLTFNLGSYCPYFFAEKYELIPDVKVSYYDTNGTLKYTETVEGGSKLKFKYGESDVTVSSGKKFRGWYDSNSSSAKPVEEGMILTKNLKLYAKATTVEVATTTSSHTYDLTKTNWYQNEHDLIEINGGNLYEDGSHGWIVGAGSTVKLKVAGDALVTVSNCKYAHQANMTLTDASNKVIGVASAKGKSDGENVTFKYSGGATTLTLTFADVAYVHKITVAHFVPVAFKPFKIDFRNNPYTVIIPESGTLPDNVDITGGTFHDDGHGTTNQHGYKNVTMNVVTDRPVKFYIGGCSSNKNQVASVSVDGGETITINNKTASCDNEGISTYDNYVTYIHKGTENSILVFNLGEYCPYIIAEELIDVEYDEATRTFNVAANNADQLKGAIKEANAKKGNVTIYLPNGTYDLGTDINTEVKADNIAIIGESRDGVIIKNSPEKQGLGTSATLKNTSTGLYLQDLTIQCYAPYEINGGVGAEVGVALWDKGTKTICKNVYLKGKQDTYYSNGAEGMIAYFEGGKIEGAVDFICGSGNVLFNSVTLNVVNGTNSGNVIAAPSTYPSEYGYLFANCRVTGNDSYYLARGWQAHETASPAFTFIVTSRDENDWPNNVEWGESIMANNDEMTRRFAAYLGVNKKGMVKKMIKDEDADPLVIRKSDLRTFAGDWDPAAIISQHKPIKTNGAGWASYTAFTDVQLNGDGVKVYAAKEINAKSVTLESVDDNKISAGTPVFIHGAQSSKYYVEGTSGAVTPKTNLLKPVLFDTTIGDGSNAFVLGTRDGVCGLYSVNSTVLIPAGKCYLYDKYNTSTLAKDELEIVIAEAETTGIGNVVADVDADAAKYNLAGQKVGNGYKGIVVRKDGKKYLAK